MILSLLIFSAGYAQDTTQTREDEREVHKEQPEFELRDTTQFILEDQELTFTPNELGFSIMKSENGEEIEYGNLRRTTEDGLYILTSTEEDEASFGRFDETGNFRALRYDIETDSVVEENFTIQDPVERRDRERRKGDPEIDEDNDNGKNNNNN